MFAFIKGLRPLMCGANAPFSYYRASRPSSNSFTYKFTSKLR